MSENFESEAHDYLLHHMEAAPRRAFEAELQRSPAAREALKACAQALAGFACDVAQPEALSAADQSAALNAIVAATQAPGARTSVAQPARPELPAQWHRFFWPAAAVILLALNLFEFDRPLAPPMSPGASGRVADGTAGQNETSATRGVVPAPKQAADSGTGSASAGERPGATAAMPPATRESAEVTRLRATVAELQQSQDRIRAEYDALVRRIADQADAGGDRDLNRLATMELVDAGSFARGDRRGLVSEGRGILTEPGVVVLPDLPPPAGSSSSSVARQPYAWSVFDEKEHRGYLNLYQLPVLTADQAMQIWVRPGGAVDFQRVGEVPQQYSGGGGGVQYTLPSGTPTPAEILITIEPRNEVPTVPTGARVLQGP